MYKNWSESFVEALAKEPDVTSFWDAFREHRRNPALGIIRFRKLADSGSALSQYYLGEAYLAGEGVGQNVDLGLEWLTKSAQSGLTEAAYQISRTHRSQGKMDAALSELVKLSKNGHALSSYNLGTIHSFDHRYKDLKKAEKFFQEAVRGGNLMAKKDYGLLMMRGYLGWWRIPCGLWVWLTVLCPSLSLMLRFPESDRLRSR